MFAPLIGVGSKGLISDYLVGITCAAFLHVLLHLQYDLHNLRQGWYSWAAKRLAGMSYTLYLAHLPLLVFFVAALSVKERWQPNLRSYLSLAAIVLSVFVYSYVVSRLTEANTDWIRNLVKRRLPLRQPIPSCPDVIAGGTASKSL